MVKNFKEKSQQKPSNNDITWTNGHMDMNFPKVNFICIESLKSIGDLRSLFFYHWKSNTIEFDKIFSIFFLFESKFRSLYYRTCVITTMGRSRCIGRTGHTRCMRCKGYNRHTRPYTRHPGHMGLHRAHGTPFEGILGI